MYIHVIIGLFLLSGTLLWGQQDLGLCLFAGRSLNWQSTVGNSYQAQWSENNGLIWNNLGSSVSGIGAEQEHFDANYTNGRTYRILETSSTSATSLIENGGFEEGTDGIASHWDAGSSPTFARSLAAANTGNYSFHSTIENDGNTPSGARLIQSLPENSIEPSQSYDLSFWIKEIRTGVSYVQQYEIQWLDQSNAVVGTSGLTSFSSTPDTWVEITANSLIAPTDARSARISFRFVTGAVVGGLGEIFIDDVSLTTPTSPSVNSIPFEEEEATGIRWNTHVGTRYQLLESEDLVNWSFQGNQIIGDGNHYTSEIHTILPSLFFKVQSVDATTQFSDIVSLYNAETTLDPELQEETETALITYMGDRARDRHAREDMFEAYDHYLSWYWEERTLSLEIVDLVAKGGSTITFNYTTQAELGAPEFRAFYRGINTVAEYYLNLLADNVGPNQYTATISSHQIERRALQLGDRIEIEISQFLAGAQNGRNNYYGTTFLYIVGEGVVPWEGRGELLDSFPLPEEGWLGGLTTLPYQYSNEPDNRFKQTAGNISPASIQPFMEGRRLHHTDFGDGSHSEPGNPIFAEQVNKLGPQFIARSCVECHINNGRSLSPAIDEPFLQGVVKVGLDAAGSPHPSLGTVLQPHATNGSGEGALSIASYTLTEGTYGDGTPYSIRKPNFTFSGETPSHFSVRYSQQLVGLGLLEAIEEQTILSLADPEDANNDGISGRPQIVTDPITGEARLGRFTAKASQPSVTAQIAQALNADMGLTSTLFPTLDDGTTSSQSEIDNAELEEMNRYVSLLGVSARRDLEDAEALQGEALFNSIGCVDCHITTLTTGPYHPMAELRNQTIHPFTDLLIHDMGAGLADNMGEGLAAGSEWRTAPLWNIGLTHGVSGGEAYLHDGRARTLEEAILWHGGEGENSKEAFRTLELADRNALIKFLKSL